jgi:hypothetical protein
LTLAAARRRNRPSRIGSDKDQFQVVLLAKAAAESGALRYLSILAERDE